MNNVTKHLSERYLQHKQNIIILFEKIRKTPITSQNLKSLCFVFVIGKRIF